VTSSPEGEKRILSASFSRGYVTLATHHNLLSEIRRAKSPDESGCQEACNPVPEFGTPRRSTLPVLVREKSHERGVSRRVEILKV
jgi:hypothetical protein